ncbi:MAG: sulfur carrier protein ThiS adenylyltransferase ThiF [Bacillota bacterium]
MNVFQKMLLKYWGEGDLSKIQAVKVGIAGTGGLGSNCACMLARSGVQRFALADRDCVEFSNLNRQFFFADQLGRPKVEALKHNLLRINPDLEIDVFRLEIHAGNLDALFGDCHAIVEAFDRAEAKKMLLEHYWDSGKLVVAASGVAGLANIEGIRTQRLRDNIYLVGDLVSEAGAGIPPLAPGVSAAAAKQANAVLMWVLGEEQF